MKKMEEKYNARNGWFCLISLLLTTLTNEFQWIEIIFAVVLILWKFIGRSNMRGKQTTIEIAPCQTHRNAPWWGNVVKRVIPKKRQKLTTKNQNLFLWISLYISICIHNEPLFFSSQTHLFRNWKGKNQT